MKIWIDITNAPHVLFFKDFICEWKENGHEVLVTARDLSGSLQLLELHKIDYFEIGSHYGANKFQKILGFPIRCFQLWRFLRKIKLDVAVSQSSFYSPIVAKSLGIKCIYTNDNEYAKGNLVAHWFATHVLYPQSLEPKVSNSWFARKFVFYPGVKEGIYFSPNLPARKFPEIASRICFRPEPWTAQYHKKDNLKLNEILQYLCQNRQVTILPRGEVQRKYFESLKLKNLNVAAAPLSSEQIFKNFDLFIGAGGSMSREFSLVGMPTISIYQGKLLSVDELLINMGVMVHKKELDLELLDSLPCKQELTDAFTQLQADGNNARKILINLVMRYKSQK